MTLPDNEQPCYYPLFLDLRGVQVVVVGGGAVACRKVQAFLQSAARVTVIAPAVDEGLRILAEKGIISIRSEPFTESHLDGFRLVVAATNDPVINQRVSKEAVRQGIPVNVVDYPELSSFIVPSMMRRGTLTIAVSTGGKAPALSRRLREYLEGIVGTEYEQYVELLGELRAKVKEKHPDDPDRRREIFEKLTDGRLLELLRSGDTTNVETFIKTCIL